MVDQLKPEIIERIKADPGMIGDIAYELMVHYATVVRYLNNPNRFFDIANPAVQRLIKDKYKISKSEIITVSIMPEKKLSENKYSVL